RPDSLTGTSAATPIKKLESTSWVIPALDESWPFLPRWVWASQVTDAQVYFHLISHTPREVERA
ncbi:MAG: hypothetical protein WCF90_02085, partial [Methanomicrobiales archaeon]